MANYIINTLRPVEETDLIGTYAFRNGVLCSRAWGRIIKSSQKLTHAIASRAMEIATSFVRDVLQYSGNPRYTANMAECAGDEIPWFCNESYLYSKPKM